MAPSGRSRTRTRTRAKPTPTPKPKPTRKPRITRCKKRPSKSKNIQETPAMEDLPSSSSTTTSLKIDGFDFEGVDDHISTTSPCSTPKAQKFRIPEIVTCPPAPKKQRMISNCSLQRRPIAFFAPPDIELFFFYARHDISV
ncbi:cyclin-dependent protein kinase inhibitor SMR13 [Ricinus communis]|uniref:Uncharacterized protein n=1 Tax=Ricinus communis TaxID=3988 RepID=B9RID1_RICCO|nr:cyclin-dependent protein kinase inhibitor SMR13 [Ricinus communis]EEF48903.1 conserved hypothetical protein [Ricinus communis]|eukprot:XP_015571185.1 cyclin-dependent protein kinase inhibitor SMR13 [Ricinus communis]